MSQHSKLLSGDQTYTYRIDGKDAFFISNGDLHDEKYDKYLKTADLNVNNNPNIHDLEGHCIYQMRISPTSEFEDAYRSKVPLIYACLTAITFSLLITFFYVYDFMVRMRNLKMIDTAARSSAIVTSMFPEGVRDKLLGNDKPALGIDYSGAAIGNIGECRTRIGGRSKMREYISTGDCEGDQIAELFLDTTVLFMDICGFTAWSSTRHPNQVFTLLQNIYREFDWAAKLRRVFKVPLHSLVFFYVSLTNHFCGRSRQSVTVGSVLLVFQNQ